MLECYFHSAKREGCTGDSWGGEVILLPALDSDWCLHEPTAARRHHDAARVVCPVPQLHPSDIWAALSAASQDGGASYEVEDHRHVGGHLCQNAGKTRGLWAIFFMKYKVIVLNLL